METLTCKKCGRTLPLTKEFWAASNQSSNGFRKWRCKACINKYNRECAAKPEVRQNKSAYQKAHPREKSSKVKSVREWKRRYPKKDRAHRIVMIAKKRGRLIPQPCAECGHTPTQAHHSDYNKPLDVIWLCHRCHTIEHHKEHAA